jgi:hypothetical protein
MNYRVYIANFTTESKKLKSLYLVVNAEKSSLIPRRQPSIKLKGVAKTQILG